MTEATFGMMYIWHSINSPNAYFHHHLKIAYLLTGFTTIRGSIERILPNKLAYIHKNMIPPVPLLLVFRETTQCLACTSNAKSLQLVWRPVPCFSSTHSPARTCGWRTKLAMGQTRKPIPNVCFFTGQKPFKFNLFCLIKRILLRLVLHLVLEVMFC